MPTSRDPNERMEFWQYKDNGTLYMNNQQLRERIIELENQVARLTGSLEACRELSQQGFRRWTDEYVAKRAGVWELLMVGHANMPARDYIEAAMIEVRDDLSRQITELQQTIETARTQSLTSSAPCPLCAYDDGGLVEMCQMHKDLFRVFGGRDSRVKINSVDEPDWSAVPWAQYHVFDSGGVGWFSDEEPELYRGDWMGGLQTNWYKSGLPMPEGMDYQFSLKKRPEGI